ncbi:MAG: pilus assembly PilX family protein [Ostreibacterium sp.]
MKKNLGKKAEQGIALLASLMLVILFTVLGMMIAQQGKENEQVTGANVRYGVVFEAAEKTLRDAISFMNLIPGLPISTADGTLGRNDVANFNTDAVEKMGKLFSLDIASSFTWAKGALESKVCGSATCIINFPQELDGQMWDNFAIKSKLATASAVGGNAALPVVESSNYILETETYTLIQLLRSIPESQTTSNKAKNYYLITVKASGYPPGANHDVDNSRENVIVQAVYAKVD